MPRLLIVTADDFGLTAGVSRGILRAHAEGIVTATSVLAVAPGLDGWSGPLRDSGLAAGAHLAVVGEDRPLLAAHEIPSLVDGQGRFPRSWRTLVARCASARIDPDDLRRELSAQVEALRAVGLVLTHVNTHQHVHLWPTVRRVVIELATTLGIPAVRSPATHRRTPTALGVSLLSRATAGAIAAAGLATTDAYAGLDEAGALDRTTLLGVLGRLGDSGASTVEVTSHPGEAHDPDRDRYRWDYRWGDELAALCDPSARALVADSGMELGSFEDLPGVRRGG